MNDSPLRDRLIALSLLPYLTPTRVRLLTEFFDSVEAACNASSGVLQGLLSLTPEQADEVKGPLTNAERVHALRDSVVTLLDPEYPPLLKEIPDPPLALHVRGNRALLSSSSIAVVGSRRAAPYSINAAHTLTRHLVSSGLTIVSGLARGIDGAAHQAALEAKGNTIAVLGTGIDIVYPRSHAKLYRMIEERGAIISELPPGTPPRPENFPMRNRLISGLSLGTVIVEATSRSGSLITARMAAEQNREVFAVPGSIFAAGSEGTHRLIQYGAKLVHDVDDILTELNLPKARIVSESPDSPLREVLELLSRDEGLHIDTLNARAKSNVAEALLQLELEGWIRALPGARYVRIK